MNQIDIKAGLSSIPAVLIAMLPQVFCPACWPAYAGLLSSIGVGFVDYTPYLLPVTVILLVISMVTLAYKAKTRRGYGPLIIGTIGSLLIVVGKFVLDIDIILYLGAITLITGSMWNAWPKKKDANDDCAVCQ